MNQGKSDEIERIFERIDTALAVRTEHANTARERRFRCFTDRASVAMALGKPLNTTATQVTSARRRLMFLVHEDNKRGNLTRYAAWMAGLVFSAANEAGLMVAAWDDPAARPPFVKVLDWPCPDTGRAGPSNAPLPNTQIPRLIIQNFTSNLGGSDSRVRLCATLPTPCQTARPHTSAARRISTGRVASSRSSSRRNKPGIRPNGQRMM